MKLTKYKPLLLLSVGVLLAGCGKGDHQAIDDTVQDPQEQGEYEKVGDEFFQGGQVEDSEGEGTEEIEEQLEDDNPLGARIITASDNSAIDIFETEGEKIVYELIEPNEDDTMAVYAVVVTDYNDNILESQFNYITSTYVLATEHDATVQQQKNQGVDIVSIYKELSDYLPNKGDLSNAHVDLAHVYQVSPTDYENYVSAMSDILEARAMTVIETDDLGDEYDNDEINDTI